MSLALLNRAVQYDEIYCFKLYAIVCFMVLTNTLFTAIFVGAQRLPVWPVRRQKQLAPNTKTSQNKSRILFL